MEKSLIWFSGGQDSGPMSVKTCEWAFISQQLRDSFMNPGWTTIVKYFLSWKWLVKISNSSL